MNKETVKYHEDIKADSFITESIAKCSSQFMKSQVTS